MAWSDSAFASDPVAEDDRAYVTVVDHMSSLETFRLNPSNGSRAVFCLMTEVSETVSWRWTVV